MTSEIKWLSQTCSRDSLLWKRMTGALLSKTLLTGTSLRMENEAMQERGNPRVSRLAPIKRSNFTKPRQPEAIMHHPSEAEASNPCTTICKTLRVNTQSPRVRNTEIKITIMGPSSSSSSRGTDGPLLTEVGAISLDLPGEEVEETVHIKTISRRSKCNVRSS